MINKYIVVSIIIITLSLSLGFNKAHAITRNNVGIVVLSSYGCDYYIVETNLGYSLVEWYRGFLQSEGDVLYGNFNNFGFKNIYNKQNRKGRIWVEDYMLSEDSVLEKYYEKCN